MQKILDFNGNEIREGMHVKYSYNDFKVPVFTGIIIKREDSFFIEHSNRVVVALDDSIKYIEVVAGI